MQIWHLAAASSCTNDICGGQPPKQFYKFLNIRTNRGSTANMPQLQEEWRLFGMDCLNNWLPSFNLLLSVDAWYIGIPATGLGSIVVCCFVKNKFCTKL